MIHAPAEAERSIKSAAEPMNKKRQSRAWRVFIETIIVVSYFNL